MRPFKRLVQLSKEKYDMNVKTVSNCGLREASTDILPSGILINGNPTIMGNFIFSPGKEVEIIKKKLIIHVFKCWS